MKNKLTFCCLLFASLIFCSTTKGDLVVLDQKAGATQWNFENFTNVGNPYATISQTIRLADENASFTSVTLDVKATVDAWWRIYNTVARTIDAPTNATLGFSAQLYVNGQWVSGLGYGTPVTFETPELEFTGRGYGFEDYFYTVGTDPLERQIVLDMTKIPTTNELNITWKVDYTSATELFYLLEDYSWNWYCGGGQWSADGVMNISYDSTMSESTSTTPEPATMLIFGMGAACLGLTRLRRFSRRF